MNLTVPRVDAYNDIFDFITEFETITATLPAEEQVKLLVKAFPPGRLRNYYDKEIKPYVLSSDWTSIKHKIISYYSDTEDKDRHLKRLQSMSFDVGGQRKLFDYVEDLLYTLSKALGHQDDELKIRYVKANLPPEVTNALLNSNQYNTATTINEFIKGVKQYDKAKSFKSGSDLKNSELVTVVKQMLTEIVKDENKPKKAKVAGLQDSSRESSPNRGRPKARANSPGNKCHQCGQDRNPHTREPSPNPQFSNYRRRPSPSPPRQFVGYNEPNRQYYQSPPRYPDYQIHYQRNDYVGNQPTQGFPNHPRPVPRSPSPGRGPQNNYPMQIGARHDQAIQRPQRVPRADQNNDYRSLKAFDDEAYFRKFGIPPVSCRKCGRMHWERHCLEDHLN